MTNQQGFKRLYYHGIPIELRDDVPPGVVYLMNTDPEKEDTDTIWVMRCMANDIEGKITWPWSKLVWKVKRWLSK